MNNNKDVTGMKKVLFLTNFASPYRVHFFDELGKYMDVTVLYSDRVEDIKHRNAQWFEDGSGGFHPVQLKQTASVKDEWLCLDVLKWVKKPYDAIVIGGYSSPTAILAMAYLRLRGIPFYMEVDGGLIRQEWKLKYFVKKSLVCLAKQWLSTGPHTTEYLVHYGAKAEAITEYPFTSLYEQDLLAGTVSKEEKRALRQELGIPEENMILAIGQFIHRKGFDILMQAASSVRPDAGIYIVGGEPTEEYKHLRQELGLTNVHFLGFQKKEQLAKIYKASDLFVLPTREDIWGLVINEAMAYGLPVVTTDRCVAGLDLVKNGVNGYIVPIEDAETLAEKLNQVLDGDMEKMGAASLEAIRPYTLENMAKTHWEILEGRR